MADVPSSGPVTDRRQFLRGTLGVGGGLLAMGVGGCAPRGTAAPAPAPVSSGLGDGMWPDARDPADFIDHGLQPVTIETRRGAMAMTVVTPIPRFFVRNNLPLPPTSVVERPDAWEIEIAGVASPRSFTLADLKRMSFETIATVVQCSGNGRLFFPHGASGSQWEVGAAGCALWTGVRVGDLVQSLGGPVEGMRFLTSLGGEVAPEGVDPLTALMERSIPLEKGLADCMLAWEMNGQPIPLLHGGPLRLIVPGYYGVNQVKYVRRLAFTASESQVALQRTGYRFRPIGVPGGPDQPSMWEMNVKSWLNGPGANGAPVARGRTVFHGVAFSGSGPVSGVDYSIDDGASWTPAEFFGPDLGPFAWRTFRITLDLEPGGVSVATRARDATGAVQPPDRTENERAYGHNGWRDHALQVTVVDALPQDLIPGGQGAGGAGAMTGAAGAGAGAAAGTPGGRTLSEDGARGRAALLDTDPSCGACHTLADAGTRGALGPDLDALRPTEDRVISAVTNGLGTMPAYGDDLPAATIRDIARYIVEATR